MKKYVSCFLLLLLLITPLFSFVTYSRADELDDINKQINDLTDELSKSIAATTPLESQLTNMQNQIKQIKININSIENDITLKKQQIDKGYQDLEAKQLLFNATVKDYYIQSYYNSPLITFMSANSASEITQTLAYQKAETDQDKSIITNIALSITDLETKKANLEQEETRLAAAKADLDTQSAKLDTIVQGAKAYQATLSTQIAQLSAKQQQLLEAKYASLGIPSSAYTTQGGCSSDLTNGKDPGFSPRFGFFTYGVPHRVGMSQYGAKGRADAGQGYNDILNAYFANISITNIGTGANVTVNGTNDYGETFSNQSMNVEDYLKHIYEMPSGWAPEALKAQAIAARSFVMHTINSGQTTVAPNQSFQEIKTELNAQPWIDAVNATSGQVMQSGGQPIEAWFSSTAGGYFHSSSDLGWSSTPYTKTGLDATGPVNNFSDLQNNAYDRSSPWFYCDWGGRAQYANTAWLQPSEVADIVNVMLLAKADSGTQTHLAQTDKPNPDGTDTWDAGRVRQELSNRGITPYSSISSISVNADFGSGAVTTVSVNGDGGSQSIAGDFFKTYFNLRAPANIQIVGPLYNVEQR